MPTQPSTGFTRPRPRPVTKRQLEALCHLARVSLDFPGMVVPTRECGVRMDSVRALARKKLIGWQLTNGGQSQGIVVTREGLRAIERHNATCPRPGDLHRLSVSASATPSRLVESGVADQSPGRKS